jgi:peptidoglycan glycosyltransferase
MRELRHVSTGILIAFLIIGLSATYWAVIGDQALLARSENPRLVEAARVIERGSIYDQQGILLANTTANYNGIGLRRLYPHPEAAPATGYYSLRYGVGGIEATYDDLLSGREGPGPLEEAQRNLLHQPAVGGDVRLTLDLTMQKAAVEAMGDYAGAIVVATIPDGSIRAMVSAPHVNPNMLDENWPLLIESPDAPLLNRVTQGVYQPGGLLQTVLLAEAISQRVRIDQPILNSAAPVAVNGLTLTCGTVPPEGDTLTLSEAYIYGCPGAFTSMTSLLAPTQIDYAFWRFGLSTAPPLIGLDTEIADSPLPIAALQDTPAITAALTGQNALLVTPLQALEIISAVANRGNAPQYRLVDAIRYPDSATWETVPHTTLSRAVLTHQAATLVKSLMRSATTQGVSTGAQTAASEPIIGHAATAYTGPEATPIQWFIGMIELGEGQSVVIVVVIEDAASPAETTQIGGQVLQRAAEHYALPAETDAEESTTPQPSATE